MAEEELRLKKVASAAKNMSALVDDIAKRARRNFKDTGDPKTDGKFLKESVSAMKELFEILGEYDEDKTSDGVVIRIEKQAEDWGK